MIKKITFISLLVVSIITAAAQQYNNNDHRNLARKNGAKDISFSVNDIQYWVGNGSNQAILIIAWDESSTPNALAWGYRWNGTLTAAQLLQAVDSADSRLSLMGISTGFVSNFTYTDSSLSLTPEIDYWCYKINGTWAAGVSSQSVSNGDLLEFSDGCNFSMTTACAVSDPTGVTDTTPLASDAIIDSNQILYWVGEGSNQVVMAVNWNSPDTALAWGYRFSQDSVTLQDMMDAIDSVDNRFHYIAGNWGVNDIQFITDLGDTLKLSSVEGGYNYWWNNINGTAASSGYDQQYLHNGDFTKWGDPTCGIVLNMSDGFPSEIVWTTPISPVPAPILLHGPYDGAVGTTGCLAIENTDTRITHWATDCILQRGYQNISDSLTLVTYGNESDATGAVTNSSNMSVVSLGDGGTATLTFNGYITNGTGADFAVYENSFSDYFLELAFVEVSSDGINFVRFPAVSLTQTTSQVGPNATLDPTNLYNLAGKYRSLWGTPFDLEELRDSANIDIDHISHVRITDVVGSINPMYGTYDSQGNLVNDPFPTVSYSGGFDLDGVGVLHFSPLSISSTEVPHLRISPNPASCVLRCNLSQDENTTVEIYDMTGRKVMEQRTNGNETSFNVSSLARGIYVVKAGTLVQKVVLR